MSGDGTGLPSSTTRRVVARRSREDEAIRQHVRSAPATMRCCLVSIAGKTTNATGHDVGVRRSRRQRRIEVRGLVLRHQLGGASAPTCAGREPRAPRPCAAPSPSAATPPPSTRLSQPASSSAQRRSVGMVEDDVLRPIAAFAGCRGRLTGRYSGRSTRAAATRGCRPGPRHAPRSWSSMPPAAQIASSRSWRSDLAFGERRLERVDRAVVRVDAHPELGLPSRAAAPRLEPRLQPHRHQQDRRVVIQPLDALARVGEPREIASARPRPRALVARSRANLSSVGLARFALPRQALALAPWPRVVLARRRERVPVRLRVDALQPLLRPRRRPTRPGRARRGSRAARSRDRRIRPWSPSTSGSISLACTATSTGAWNRM